MENRKNILPLCLVLLKRRLRKPSFWIILACGLLVQYLLGALVLPDVRNTRVGILNGGGRYAAEVCDELKKISTQYTYCFYTDETLMRDRVSTGYLDCGFVLVERLDETDASSLNDRVTYISSSSTSKGPLVQEELFSVLLGYLSEGILTDLTKDGRITADISGNGVDAVIAAYRDLYGGKEVLSVFFEDSASGERRNAVDPDSSPSGSGKDESAEADAGTHAGGGMHVAVLLIFSAALLFAADSFHASEKSICQSLRPAGRRRFRRISLLIPLCMFSAAVFLFCVIGGQAADISPLRCTLAFAAGVPLTALWAALFSGLFRHEPLYLYAAVAVVFLAAVFSAGQLLTVSVLTRQIAWLKWLFPTTWYLGLLGIG